MPVLLFSNLASALVWIPLVLTSHFQASWLPHPELMVYALTPMEHGLLFLKSAIVGSSWLFAYFAVKHLPISIAGSVRSTGPVFTILGALLLYQESPNSQQWIGIAVTLVFFIALSRVGKREGIHFRNDRWIWLIVVGTLLSACSGLYDKYLLGVYGFSPATVQAWFSIYLFVFMLIPMLGWMRGVVASLSVSLALDDPCHRDCFARCRLLLLQSHGRSGRHGFYHFLPTAWSGIGDFLCRNPVV